METLTKKTSKSAGDSGEYFVAYMLSRMGLSAALTTSGTSAIDILVTKDGSKSISIQVKSSWARTQPRQWMIGTKRPHVSDDLIYIFCNLKEDLEDFSHPEIFIVPSSDVLSLSTWSSKAPLFKIPKGRDSDYLNRWDLITDLLGAYFTPFFR